MRQNLRDDSEEETKKILHREIFYLLCLSLRLLRFKVSETIC